MRQRNLGGKVAEGFSNESLCGPARSLAGPIRKSCAGSVRRRDIDVNDRAGAFGSSVARGSTDVALQPVLGILPKRRTGFGGCHCAGFASGGADLAWAIGVIGLTILRAEVVETSHRHFLCFTFR